jgi:hypothetical protein
MPGPLYIGQDVLSVQCYHVYEARREWWSALHWGPRTSVHEKVRSASVLGSKRPPVGGGLREGDEVQGHRLSVLEAGPETVQVRLRTGGRGRLGPDVCGLPGGVYKARRNVAPAHALGDPDAADAHDGGLWRGAANGPNGPPA